MNGTVLFVLLIAAMAADFWTTLRGLKLGATEANPVLGKRPSAAKLLALKLAGVGIIAFGIWPHLGKTADPLITFVSLACIAALSYVSVHNYRIGNKLRARDSENKG